MTDQVYKELYDTRKQLEQAENVVQTIMSELAVAAGFPDGAQVSIREVLDIVKAKCEPQCGVVDNTEESLAG